MSVLPFFRNSPRTLDVIWTVVVEEGSAWQFGIRRGTSCPRQTTEPMTRQTRNRSRWFPGLRNFMHPSLIIITLIQSGLRRDAQLPEQETNCVGLVIDLFADRQPAGMTCLRVVVQDDRTI